MIGFSGTHSRLANSGALEGDVRQDGGCDEEILKVVLDYIKCQRTRDANFAAGTISVRGYCSAWGKVTMSGCN
jgi:hypothetical protein